jgi:acyl carrier protein
MPLTADAVLAFLKDSLGVDVSRVNPDTLLFSDGVVDSFALVSLLTFIESACGFRIAPMDVSLEHFDSIERILAYAQRRAKEDAPG